MNSFFLCLRVCLCCLLVGIFNVYHVNAQSQQPSNSLLWEVSGNGLQKPSYLFGTIHLICPDDLLLSDSVRHTLSLSKQLYLELDMDEPDMMLKMTQQMQMKNGTLLSDLLEPEEYTQVQHYFQDSIGLDLQMLSPIKPFFIASLLFNRILECQPDSYESRLMDLAKQEGKEILGLETVEAQFAIFDSIPYQKQAKMILSIIENLPKAKSEFDELVQVYKTADVDKLYTISKNSSFDIQFESDLMLDQRNRNWISPMKQQMQLQSTFFAFGAAHLGGDQGIIALLRREGYKVRAIR